MKFTVFNHSLREGVFPAKKLAEIDQKITIKVSQTGTPFLQKIEIEVNMEKEDNELEVAFQLGKVVGILKAKEYM